VPEPIPAGAGGGFRSGRNRDPVDWRSIRYFDPFGPASSHHFGKPKLRQKAVPFFSAFFFAHRFDYLAFHFALACLSDCLTPKS
jgi:hypothetical protein